MNKDELLNWLDAKRTDALAKSNEYDDEAHKNWWAGAHCAFFQVILELTDPDNDGNSYQNGRH